SSKNDLVYETPVVLFGNVWLSRSIDNVALSLGYVVDSDLEKDEKDPKEDPAGYPADRGDNDDDDVEKDEEDKEEEEH
nr:hypothetical protein [Tanacetum cinerariifolium]